jgi:uncharacterized protein (DUF1697 family)
MPVYISMVRGINVGGHNKIKMEELRALHESLGHKAAQSYIQSGNIVFKTKQLNQGQLTKQICDGLHKKFGFRPAVILRTTSELREVIANNPFAGRKNIDPRRLLVTFLAGEPKTPERERLLSLQIAPEELRVIGRELFVYFPDGMARPKFSWSMVEKILKISGTGRNWNTVNKLLEMAESIEASK